MNFSYLTKALLILSCSSLCAIPLRKPKECEPGPGWWFELRHREPKGIGYDEGYTSGELFFSPMWDDDFQPFADLRIHLFNDGRWAGNAGAGIRYQFYDRAMALGANAFYDYRDDPELKSINQVGLGIEALTKFFEFRSNGYLTVGATKLAKCPEFTCFSCNSAFAEQDLTAALSHWDAEFGFPLRGVMGPIDFFFGVGPYYLFERELEGCTLGQKWGVQSRLELGVLDNLMIGGSVSYDPIFNVRGQGYIGLSFTYSPRNLRQGGRRFKRTYRDCISRAVAFARVTQRVERSDIIIVENKTKNFSLTPTCKGNCRILFVDSCCPGGCGTFEAPFASIDEAIDNSLIGDIIYVFPGVPDLPPSVESLFLLDNQRLISSGVNMDLDGICVPACTPGCFPTLSVVPELDALVLANCNEVAGFCFVDNNRAINTEFAGDFDIHNNFFNNNTIAISGPLLSGIPVPAGKKFVSSCQFLNNEGALFLEIARSNLTLNNNDLTIPEMGDGFAIDCLGMKNNVSARSNTARGGNSSPVSVTLESEENVVDICSNTILTSDVVGPAGIAVLVLDGGNNKLILRQNAVTGGLDRGIDLSVAADTLGNNRWMIFQNGLNKQLSYEAGDGLAQRECIRFLSNVSKIEKAPAFVFENLGPQEQVAMESPDLKLDGIQKNNTGFVVADNVEFVPIGTCDCD